MYLNQLIKKYPDILPNAIFSKEKISKRKESKYSELQKIDDVDLIICLGIDEGVYRSLESWILLGRKLVFLEKDTNVLLSISKKMQEDTRVAVYLFREGDDTLLKEIVWSQVTSNHRFICHPDLKPSYKTVKDTLLRLELGKHLAISDVADFGKKVFENIFINCKNLQTFKNGADLKNAFENIPAIICGAGPSLKKEIQKIKKLTNKALIFAGGSALNVLGKEGIIPHFGGGVDKNAPFEKFLSHLGFITPFFFQMRISSENLSLIHQEPFCFGEAKEALFSSLLEEEINLSPFSSGWCVGNFLSQVALYLGCNPIIFVGMDFSYTKGKKYADSEEGIQGEEILQKDFEMAKDYSHGLAENYKNTIFINASKSYERDSLLKEMSLAHVIKNFLQTEFDLEGLIHQKLQESKKLFCKKDYFQMLQESFLVCKKILDQGMETFDLMEKKLKKEISYKYIISPIWRVYAPLFFSKMHSMKEGLDEKKKKKIHEYLFFQRVIDIYITEIDRLDNGRKKV